MRPDTKCLHEGYHAGNGEPLALPIYQSTTYRYDSAEHVAQLFDLTADGHMYSRISNPTVEFVEKKIAALEGGVGAVCVSSGQAASLTAVLNIVQAGDHIVSSSKIYGGTFNLFSVTLKRLGIETTFVDPDDDESVIASAFRPNTKLLFGEAIANPVISVLDIEKFARLAHSHGVPFVIDNTFPTPILLRPIEYGADIVIHSTSKYFDGHAIQVGGVVVDSGNFDWKDYPCLTQPDDSYHGIVYTEKFGRAAYINKLRFQLVRDFGVLSTPFNAFLCDLGMQTLGVRMERHCRNAEQMAAALESHPAVEKVNYPTLESNEYHALAQKYLPDGCSGVISFVVKGGRNAAARFMANVKLANNIVHVADVRTCVLHPASETHRQLSDEQLVECGVTPGLVRLSVGIEHIDDIKSDILAALDNI